jgi:hypothetical protein
MARANYEVLPPKRLARNILETRPVLAEEHFGVEKVLSRFLDRLGVAAGAGA